MSEAHTRGLWDVVETVPDRSCDYVGETFIRSINGATLATLTNYNAVERRANARLMAEAPKLLRVLQTILSRQDTYLIDDDANAARAAIARATSVIPLPA